MIGLVRAGRNTGVGEVGKRQEQVPKPGLGIAQSRLQRREHLCHLTGAMGQVASGRACLDAAVDLLREAVMRRAPRLEFSQEGPVLAVELKHLLQRHRPPA